MKSQMLCYFGLAAGCFSNVYSWFHIGTCILSPYIGFYRRRPNTFCSIEVTPTPFGHKECQGELKKKMSLDMSAIAIIAIATATITLELLFPGNNWSLKPEEPEGFHFSINHLKWNFHFPLNNQDYLTGRQTYKNIPQKSPNGIYKMNKNHTEKNIHHQHYRQSSQKRKKNCNTEERIICSSLVQNLLVFSMNKIIKFCRW